MSTGHRSEAKPAAELYRMLGERDTNELYAKPVKLDTSHDTPYGGGVSVDGKTVYVDKKLYEQVTRGAIAVRGMTPKQIIQAWIEHEHTEWSIDAGDNPADSYQACHGYATAKEERFVKFLGVDPERYEKAIEPALKRCMARDPVNPPRDLWCGPYLDQPDKRDLEILQAFRAKGVEDAFKTSKIDVHYGLGANRCHDCRHFGGGELATCAIVCGLVRADRQCDEFEAKR
jgi:hypothetical protein